MHLNWRIWLGIANCVAFSIWGNSTIAQITPDTTLPENSRVTINDNIINIEGGTKSGSNLFHSFSEFFVPNGSTAYFNSIQSIQNIIGRVTGKSISNIDGLIKANGTANLFLINPNGIVFGKDARLEIGGSFFATTANSVKFADGFAYSTTQQTTPLLTVSTPIGLQFGANPGLIQVQGDGQGIRSRITPSPAIDTNVGLRVQENQTLALVGGDISLEGATLKTAGGRIELGSVASNSLVSLIPIEKGFALNYGGWQSLGNIRLSQQTAVDATGDGGGDVQVTARSLKLSDGSVIETSTLGSNRGGNLTVNTSDEVQLSGVYRSPDVEFPFPGGFYAQAEQDATGTAGDITINTRLLQVQNGAQVSAVTKGAGRVGNLTVNADIVELIGNDNRFPTGLGIQVRGSANATTELKINTRVLSLSDEAFVSTSTFDSGNGANLTVNATGSVQLKTSSTLNSQATEDATDIAGNLTINTPLLRLESGAYISAGTFGNARGGNLTVNTNGGAVELTGLFTPEGKLPSGLYTQQDTSGAKGAAGDLTINTRTLRLDQGAEISASTFGEGSGGNVLVNATESVQLLFASIVGALAGEDSTGRSGDVTINTDKLTIKDGAIVSVRSRGLGNAGNLNLNAGFILLDSNSRLNANTTSITTDPVRQQANININSVGLASLRGSQITANAQGINVIGGNININSGVLAAFENSDITANSDEASGGKVEINTQAIFGTQFRNALTPNSDITATGANPQLSGTVQINTPDVDPSNGLVPLNVDVVDVARLLDDNLCAKTANSSFTYTGRGGLPPSPSNTLNSNAVWEDWRVTTVPTKAGGERERRRKEEESQNLNFINRPAGEIVEAQGWVVDGNGDVILIANAPTVTPHKLRNSPFGCQVSIAN